MSTSVESVCGIDVGSRASRVTLCFTQDDEIRFLRVTCDPEGPNHFYGPSGAPIDRDFPTDVALDDGRLIQGRTAMENLTHRYSLKTIISVRAGIQRLDTLQQLPGGEDFCSVYNSELVTDEMIDDIVRQHFSNLRDEAIKKTCLPRDMELVIKKVILTYPDYLHHEGGNPFRQWAAYVEPIWTQVWDNRSIHFSWISEGQSIVSYISAKFNDTETDFARGKLWQKLKLPGLYLERLRFPILVIDAGGSNVNAQHTVLEFDSSGQVQCSQTYDVVGTSSGFKGEDNLSDYRICDEAFRMGKSFAEEERVMLLQDYESRKYAFDHAEKAGLSLQGGTHGAIMSFVFDCVRKAYKEVFGDMLTMIKCEPDLLLGRDDYGFGVVFCGGSFLLSGLRQKICTYMDNEVVRENKQGKGVSYAFLSICDTKWSSAVATGAAVSALSTATLLRDGGFHEFIVDRR